jgi:hypothetical protein
MDLHLSRLPFPQASRALSSCDAQTRLLWEIEFLGFNYLEGCGHKREPWETERVLNTSSGTFPETLQKSNIQIENGSLASRLRRVDPFFMMHRWFRSELPGFPCLSQKTREKQPAFPELVYFQPVRAWSAWHWPAYTYSKCSAKVNRHKTNNLHGTSVTFFLEFVDVFAWNP